jgi:deoxyribodipyrimidine photo-lyase
VGTASRAKRLLRFLNDDLKHYGSEHNQPERDVTSGLSAYLHFGHISVHEVFQEAAQREKWGPKQVSLSAKGAPV